MVQTTAKGYPYPETSDSPHGPDQLQNLAARADELTDAARMTVTERDALAAPDLYDGRVVMIVDTNGVWQRAEIYHADDPANPGGGGTWKILVDRAFANATYAPIEARAAKVYLDTSQSISNDTLTKVALDTARFDPHGLFDSANNQVLLDKTGIWVVHANVRYVGNSTGDHRRCEIQVNGGTQAVSVIGPSGTTLTVNQSVIVEVTSSDEAVELFARQDSGGSLNVVSGNPWTFLSVAYLGT